MTAEEILILRSKMMLSQRAFAKLLGVHANTVLLWESGKTTPRAIMQVRLRELWNIHGRSMFSRNPIPLSR